LIFPQRGVPPWKGVLTHGKIKPPDILLPPSWLEIAPKLLGKFHPKYTPTPDDIRLLI